MPEEERLMGRRRHSKQAQKRQNQKTKRRGGGSGPPQPLQRAHESDPECGGGREELSDGSPLWNSLDEQSLAGLSPPPSLSAVVAADYVYKSGLSSDEMEVTRKLSCLNFSVLPCSAPDALLFSRAEENGSTSHLQYAQHQDGALLPVYESVRGTIQAVDMSDIEQYSELPSATQLDVLLPTVDSQGGVDGRRQLEAMDCEQQRRRRKRTARKKPNRRTKKMRLYHHSECATPTNKPPSTIPPISSNFVQSTTLSNEGKDGEMAVGQLRRTRSFRRSRRQTRTELNDPMSCILSDTSAMCELDHDKGMNGGEMPNGDDFFDATPPAEGIPPMDMTMVEGLGCMGGPAVSLEELPNESDLTETTTDSGCEGDDEESSVEGPSGRGQNLPGWWDKEDSSSSEDEKFTQILTGTFPLMSKDGRSKFQHHLVDNSLPDEFKHPARFGILAKGGRKKRSCKPNPPSGSLTLNEVTQKLTGFVQNDRDFELQFGLVSRALCRTISCLAKVYNLECVIEQKRRLPVANPLLRKTVLTRVATRQEIEPILRNHGRESPTMLLKDTSVRDCTRAAGRTATRVLAQDSNGHICENSIVGGKAAPLNKTNLGNRMLQGMGWSPGMGLGPDGVGIKNPIVAHVRPRRVGLGY